MSNFCRAEMYPGLVACRPLMSHGEYADVTDRQTYGRMPDRYITLLLDAVIYRLYFDRYSNSYVPMGFRMDPSVILPNFVAIA